jgi:hypothetical protein
MCYQPMPFYVNGQQQTVPYNPSIANTTRIFFGSDIAYDCMEPLWGTNFISKSGTTYRFGRNDLQTLRGMGVNLLRLYDWEPRNYHKRFLDECLAHEIKVLAPVSNYFLSPGQGYENRVTLIPDLLNSFSNGEQNNGTDYHPAIAGIIMGNEPNIAHSFGVEELTQFTKDWVAKEQAKGFQSRPRIGHPQDFGIYGGNYPAWTLWTTLLDDRHLGRMRDRLFLAINTFNPANDLFRNLYGDNMGYVRATYKQFGVPLLITELGNSRSRWDRDTRRWVSNTGYLEVVNGQLSGSIAYGADHPEQRLGICHFQFADKVWLCPNGDPPGGYSPSEGSFGTRHHTEQFLGTVNYADTDFTHFDCIPDPPLAYLATTCR